MTIKKYSTGEPFSILVPAITTEVDAYGRPIRGKQKITQQFFYGEGSPVLGLVQGDILPATASVDVSDNDFSTGTATLVLDVFEIISGVHFVVGGSAADTAIALAAAISNIEGFSATPAGTVVSIEGPSGLSKPIPFYALYEGTIQNYTLTPTERFMTEGSPTFGPPQFS